MQISGCFATVNVFPIDGHANLSQQNEPVGIYLYVWLLEGNTW